MKCVKCEDELSVTAVAEGYIVCPQCVHKEVRQTMSRPYVEHVPAQEPGPRWTSESGGIMGGVF